MPSGRLGFATRRVDLMAASERAPLALYGWHDHSPPHKAWGKTRQDGGLSLLITEYSMSA